MIVGHSGAMPPQDKGRPRPRIRARSLDWPLWRPGRVRRGDRGTARARSSHLASGSIVTMQSCGRSLLHDRGLAEEFARAAPRRSNALIAPAVPVLHRKCRSATGLSGRAWNYKVRRQFITRPIELDGTPTRSSSFPRSRSNGPKPCWKSLSSRGRNRHGNHQIGPSCRRAPDPAG